MRRAFLPIALAAALAGCGGDDGAYVPPPITKPAKPMTPTQAQPPAPAAADTFAHVPDTRPARVRLGFVDADRLASVKLPVSTRQIADAVLGKGARAGDVRIGGKVVPVPAELASPSIAASTIPGTVQACLGDTAAQTILGPGAVGRDAGLGVGLIVGPGAPQLHICGAPRFKPEVHAMERTLRKSFEGMRVGETEIVEREVIAGRLDLRDVSGDELLAMLSGGRALRSVSWR